MADIFHEIDEDLRRERLGRVWKRYGAFIIAAAVLTVVAAGGWRTYEWWTLRQQEAAGARFEAALKLSDEGKHAEAEAAFAELEKDGPGGYRTLARFRAAAEQASGDRAAAVATYDKLAADTSLNPLMRDVARLRAANLLVDTAPLADVVARVQPLDTPTGAFRNSARELTGLAQFKAGDFAAAAKTFETILSDGQTPPGLRQRAELMRTLAAANALAPTPATDAPGDAPSGAPAATPPAPAVQ